MAQRTFTRLDYTRLNTPYPSHSVILARLGQGRGRQLLDVELLREYWRAALRKEGFR